MDHLNMWFICGLLLVTAEPYNTTDSSSSPNETSTAPKERNVKARQNEDESDKSSGYDTFAPQLQMMMTVRPRTRKFTPPKMITLTKRLGPEMLTPEKQKTKRPAQPEPPKTITMHPAERITDHPPFPHSLISQNYSTKETEDRSTTKKGLSRNEHSILTAVSSVNTVFIALGICFNLIVIAYFFNMKSLAGTLYYRNGFMDILCGIGFLLQTPAVFSLTKNQFPPALIFVSFFITCIAIRGSILLNCLLGSVRCIAIVNPFYPIRTSVVSQSIFIYLVFSAVLAGYDIFVFGTEIGTDNYIYMIRSLVMKPEPGFSLRLVLLGEKRVPYGLLALFYYGLPVALPCFLCLILMTIQIRSLMKSGAVQSQANTGRRTGNSDNKRKSAVTILLLTLTFVFTSLLSIVTWLIIYQDQLFKHGFKAPTWTELTIEYASISTCPLLNTLLTPAILIARGKDLRKKLMKMWQAKQKEAKTQNTTISKF